MKKWVLPNKIIKKENIVYEWVAESTACETCKALDGKLFDSANDIPNRPHPNCKCHIEIVEKESDKSLSDPFELHKREREEQIRVEMEMKKLIGDIKSLMEEIDECLNQAGQVEKILKSFEQVIDTVELEFKERKKLIKVIKKIEDAKIRATEAKTELLNLQSQSVVLQGKIEKRKVMGIPLIFVINLFKALQNNFRVLKSVGKEIVFIVKTVVTNDINKIAIGFFTTYMTGKLDFDILANGRIFFEDDARNFYNISSGFLDAGKNYIEKNGFMVDSINDLHNYKLEKFVRAKVQEQMKVSDSIGIILNENSSLAHNIASSKSFKKYIHQHKDYLNKHKYKDFFDMEFSDGGNLYHTYHFADVFDIKVDPYTGTLTCYVIDTYDFNEDEPSFIIKVPHEYQKKGLMKGFFSVVKIVIEESEWQKF